VAIGSLILIPINHQKNIFDQEYGLNTVLSRQDILNLINRQPPLIQDYIKLEEQLQPNGFDLTLQEVAAVNSAGRIAVSNSQRQVSELKPLSFDSEDYLTLAPGSYVITFNEIVNLPRNVMAIGAPRSSLLRCGVTVHMAVWDAGYSGRSQSLLVVFNPAGFRLQRNARIAQLVFMELAAETVGYQGVYQGENIRRSNNT
jgi:dUTP pyrophosphatase